MNSITRYLMSFLFSVGLFACTAQNKTALNADEFEKALQTKQPIQVLDVRTPGEFFSGHIKNALQADWNDRQEFERRVAFVDKDKPVYIYCLAGGRSAKAAAKMRSDGFKNVYELQGGINAWKAGNKPLEGKSDAKQMSLDAFNATVSGSKLVLVDFGAEWCPPCKLMEPVIKALMEKNQGKLTLLNVDGGNDQDILQQYKVTALPVFILFRDGKQVWRKDGIATEKEIQEQLN